MGNTTLKHVEVKRVLTPNVKGMISKDAHSQGYFGIVTLEAILLCKRKKVFSDTLGNILISFLAKLYPRSYLC